MFRRLILALFVTTVYCQDAAFDFNGNGAPKVTTATGDQKCNTIEGTIEGCAECYPCGHSFVQAARNIGKPISQLTLYNSSCIGNQVCCVRNLDVISVGPRIGGDCGRPGGQEGRKKNRDFGEREFPWMAFVFFKNSRADLILRCAATFIDEEFLTLVTSASCVSGNSATDLVVSFNYKPSANDHMAPVGKVVVHESYRAKSNTNDIALLSIANEAAIPQWAAPACLPAAAAQHATVCTTVAKGNFYKLNPVIKLSSECGPDTQLCASNPPLFKEIPMPGAGLYCEAQLTQQLSYVLSGIYVKPNVYTNVFKFIDWIEENKK